MKSVKKTRDRRSLTYVVPHGVEKVNTILFLFIYCLYPLGSLAKTSEFNGFPKFQYFGISSVISNFLKSRS